MIYPDLETFKKLAQAGNLIPVYREILADTETPVTAFSKIVEGDFSFLLESVEGGEKIARYSFLGTGPEFIFSSKSKKAEIIQNGSRKILEIKQTPLEILRELIKKYRPVKIEGLPRFTGGAVGFFSYDLVNFFEKLPAPKKDNLNLPDINLMFMDTLVIFDHAKHTIKIVANAFCENKNPETAYEEALEKIKHLTQRLNKPLELEIFDPSEHFQEAAPADFESNFSRSEFCGAVEKILGYIKAGDIIQAVLSQRFSKKTKAAPFEIYRILRHLNPSPYMFYLNFGDLKLIGASPEVMVRCEGKEIIIRPIAGTRPRGKTETEDLKLEQELQNDAKEKAEHIMLVDLARNDLGRVSAVGTVVVDELMAIEKYSHVMHLVSNVRGELKENFDQLDVLRASFPAGTVSGAPKIRAMEIIAELEPTARGTYAGAVGYLDFWGNLDTCITIRTILLKNETTFIQAGAGIVADSIPENEFQESINKASVLFKTIQAAEGIYRDSGH